MAAYDLQEQEQLDDLKAWWKQWGNTITFAVVLACLVIAGVQAYRWWMGTKSADASVLYSAVSDAARKSDAAKGKDAMAQLADKFSGTAYAPRAALVNAGQLFNAGDKAGAKSQLEWTIANASEDGLKAVARFRLAEIQLDDKQYDEAVKTLDAKVPDAFKGLFADLRGDAQVAAGRTAEARAAYQEAYAALDSKSGYRTYVQVKLDTVGGPAASPLTGGSTASPAVGATPGGSTMPAAPAAPTAPATPAQTPAPPK
ncbi:MAG TPA: tetratricopeptide repeat protein [Casimicrobiaceae bacterium]|nr:tetratricopeptide repeat protein [Casimicrobiaceae bacterium]